MNINDVGLYNNCMEIELATTIVDRHQNSIVKAEVKQELEYPFVKVQNPDLVENVNNSMVSMASDAYERSTTRDPLASIHMIDIQHWPKLEFNEAVHEFHMSNVLPHSIEELNSKAIDDTPSTSQHFAIQDKSNVNVGVYAKGTENILVQSKLARDFAQYGLVMQDSDVFQHLNLADQYYRLPYPLLQFSNSLKEGRIVYSDVSTSNNYNRPADTTNTTSKVISSYIKYDKGIFTCKLCRKKYDDFDRVEGHICSHLGIKPYGCTYTDCAKTFPSKEGLTSHIYLMHKAHDRFKCETCGRTFNKRGVYEEHCNKHNSVMPFDCAECGKAFPSKNAIFMHIVDVHNASSDDRSVLCPHCGKICTNHQKLKCHLRVHSEKRFVCDVCNAKFISRFKLANHKASHSTERPFQCDLCSKTYALNTTLRRHVVTAHEKVKNFTCSTCGKSFITGSFLREHQLKHEGIRKYSCETCGKTFAQASHLGAHRFSHGEKKFVCPLCGAKFNRHDNMKSHVKRHEKKVKK